MSLDCAIVKSGFTSSRMQIASTDERSVADGASVVRTCSSSSAESALRARLASASMPSAWASAAWASSETAGSLMKSVISRSSPGLSAATLSLMRRMAACRGSSSASCLSSFACSSLSTFSSLLRALCARAFLRSACSHWKAISSTATPSRVMTRPSGLRSTTQSSPSLTSNSLRRAARRCACAYGTANHGISRKLDAKCSTDPLWQSWMTSNACPLPDMYLL
mmetsp:Transcript_32089/g.84014  ORF Transcript_32089/g.84014 Transcript_32089/m.84014 type:complete len:223 (-) Transcript_32089:5254-5922(-)